MISLIAPYFVTLLGVIVGGAWDFPAFAYLFLAVGVLWTLGRGLVAHSDKRTLIITLAIHAVIYLVYNFKPEMIGAAIGIVIGLAVAIPLAVVFFQHFAANFSIGGSRSGGSESAGENRRVRMPNIIYDEGNNRWQLSRDMGDHFDYYDDNGREVSIWVNSISGTSANTSEGTFHWY